MGGDNDTNYQLMDHAIVGIPKKLDECAKLSIPFFGKLEHGELHVECFPYKIAMVKRPARDNKPEPFYYSRDPNHTGKAATRVLTSPCRILTIGELFVHHAHALKFGLQIKAFFGERSQSDQQSSQRIAESLLPTKKEELHWSAWGYFVYAFVVRLALRPWYDEEMTMYERFGASAVAYHFLEAARMMSKRRADHMNHFLSGVTYLCIHRLTIHMLLRTLTWPEDWPPCRSRRQMEMACEARFEATRRMGPDYKPSAKEWISSTQIDVISQACNAFRNGPEEHDFPAAGAKALPKEKVAEENALAIQVAMRLLVLCCPVSMPGATIQHVQDLTAQYHAWWKGQQPPTEQDLSWPRPHCPSELK